MTNENQGRVSARPVVKFVKMAIEKEGRSPTRQEAYKELTREDGSVRYHHEEAENSIEKAINDGVVKERAEKGKKVLDIPGRQQGPANPENPDPEEDETEMNDKVIKAINAIPRVMEKLMKQHTDGVAASLLKKELGLTDITSYVLRQIVEGADEKYDAFSYSGSGSARRHFWKADEDEGTVAKKENADYVTSLFDNEYVKIGVTEEDLVAYIANEYPGEGEETVKDALEIGVISKVGDSIYPKGQEPEGSGSDDAIRKGAKDLLDTLEHAKTHKVAEKTTLEGRVEKINGDIEEIDGRIEAVKSTFDL